MFYSKDEVLSVLRQFNPWWDGGPIMNLPNWRRAAYTELYDWVLTPPAPRAVVLSGARQVGKTTLLLQTVDALLAAGIKPQRILYATFDHPLLKLIGIDGLLKLWQEIQPLNDTVEYFFLDEIQYIRDWPTWLKHQVDFEKSRRIAVTGSAMPLNTAGLESGVGRWHTIKLPTLSFFEYMQLKAVAPAELPTLKTLDELFSWSPAQRVQTSMQSRGLAGHFHEYLIRGGFPQTATVESLAVSQKLLREDIVDKVLKRDMTALFGVRRVLELERTFLYLCLHDGGILDVTALATALGVKKPTVSSFLELLEAAHLIHRLLPFGYGKEVLRGRYKVYMADAAIAGSVLLRGRALLEDPVRLGLAVETAIFNHLLTHFHPWGASFSYWRNKRGQEIDLVAHTPRNTIPFEVKYSQSIVRPDDVPALRAFCQQHGNIPGYVITRDWEDFNLLAGPPPQRIIKIPAALACFWLSQPERGPEDDSAAQKNL
jgi:predicted AAA+ superfamily ATPase